MSMTQENNENKANKGHVLSQCRDEGSIPFTRSNAVIPNAGAVSGASVNSDCNRDVTRIDIGYLGVFETEEAAARAYDAAALAKFGEFARLNFLPVANHTADTSAILPYKTPVAGQWGSLLPAVR